MYPCFLFACLILFQKQVFDIRTILVHVSYLTRQFILSIRMETGMFCLLRPSTGTFISGSISTSAMLWAIGYKVSQSQRVLWSMQIHTKSTEVFIPIGFNPPFLTSCPWFIPHFGKIAPVEMIPFHLNPHFHEIN